MASSLIQTYPTQFLPQAASFSEGTLLQQSALKFLAFKIQERVKHVLVFDELLDMLMVSCVRLSTANGIN